MNSANQKGPKMNAANDPNRKPLNGLRKFVGVYREPSKPNQRTPVHLMNGRYVDIFDRPIDISRLVRVS
jgi:hypothetical protein